MKKLIEIGEVEMRPTFIKWIHKAIADPEA